MGWREMIFNSAKNSICFFFILVAVLNGYTLYDKFTGQLDLAGYLEETLDDSSTVKHIVAILLFSIGAVVFYMNNRSGMFLSSWLLLIRYAVKTSQSIQLYNGPTDFLIRRKVFTQLKWSQENHSWFINDVPGSLWDGIQTSGQCCGLDERNEWDKFRPESMWKIPIYPNSCCPDRAVTLCLAKHAYTTGCAIEIYAAFGEIRESLIYSSIILLTIGIIGIAVACTSNDRSGISIIRRSNDASSEAGAGSLQHPQPVYVSDQQADGTRTLHMVHGPMMA